MSTPSGPYKLGQRFGPYVLEAYLGAGAFKSVYRARRDNGGTAPGTVALGFPHHMDAEGIAELRKEFAVLSRLEHPNILRVGGVEETDGVTFLVMEYVEGRTLRARLSHGGPLPQDEALRTVGLVCEALVYAHSLRVLHRDVKPENIFLAADGTPKLLDFGVARILAHSSQKASSGVGTVEYMAPEQLRGATGPNADLWALGVTLYELLTGMRPFTGDVGEVIQKVLHERYDEAPLHEKTVDRRLVRVLRKMLHKDPEVRYRSAEDLLADLETVARGSRLIDDDEARLEVLVRARVPLIYVVSYEEERVLQALRQIAARLGEERRRPRPVYVWSASRGLRDAAGALVHSETVGDPALALDHAIDSPDEVVYVFLDIHRHYTPVLARLIRDAARAVRASRKSVVFLAPSFHVPEELQSEVTWTVFQLPDARQLGEALRAVESELALAGRAADLGVEDREALLRAASGLTLSEAELAFRTAAVRAGRLGSDAARQVAASKAQAIRRSGVLEYHERVESFAGVGGLEKLRAWFRARRPAFANTARYAGLPLPKGVLLAGVPGCGKSLSARALAGDWGVPLVRLDVGQLFASLVGASENNLRVAIQTAEAVSPCVLWIDEVEKGFAGVQGHGGGGVAARVFGRFLEWLEEKRSPVFVVATANELAGIPPEFLRQGRFDDVFFVGLPGAAERRAIFTIHLAKRGREPERFDLEALAKATEGFSGAEIEQAVVEGLFRAFAAERELESADLISAAAETFPLSRSRAREIGALVAWAERHAKLAG